ncbi:MAG TPA: DUF5336 domain-containing protein [Pseudonocardiaceae bacterium]|jgi:hypothetical protein|nr:DUF5336 domain-containing protein [Pseudonocardiaceae bacterium]
MSYPSGPPGGYQQQPQQQGGAPVFGQPPARPNPLSGLGIPGLLTLAVLVLALASYLCSFGGGYGLEVLALLAGGLLAGLALLPKAPNTLPFAVVLSVVGGLGMLDTVINASGGGLPTTVILVLVLGLLQAIASVVALLLEYGMIKLAPRAAVPHPAGPSSAHPAAYPPGGYQQQQPQQQPQHPQQQQQGQHQQATTYLGQQNTPQSTQFLQHPGQISHPQTPPGGNE